MKSAAIAPGRNLEGRGTWDEPVGNSTPSFPDRYGGIGRKREHSPRFPAMGRWEKRWNTPTPFAGHAIVASENTVMAAGVPMLKGYSQEDTNASYAGEKGGIAWLLDAKDGHKLQELRFDRTAGLGRDCDRPWQLFCLLEGWLSRLPVRYGSGPKRWERVTQACDPVRSNA